MHWNSFNARSNKDLPIRTKDSNKTATTTAGHNIIKTSQASLSWLARTHQAGLKICKMVWFIKFSIYKQVLLHHFFTSTLISRGVQFSQYTDTLTSKEKTFIRIWRRLQSNLHERPPLYKGHLNLSSPQPQWPLKCIPNCQNNLSATATFSATHEKVKNGHEIWSVRHVND